MFSFHQSLLPSLGSFHFAVHLYFYLPSTARKGWTNNAWYMTTKHQFVVLSITFTTLTTPTVSGRGGGEMKAKQKYPHKKVKQSWIHITKHSRIFSHYFVSLFIIFSHVISGSLSLSRKKWKKTNKKQ